jgi:hypothetical protein
VYYSCTHTSAACTYDQPDSSLAGGTQPTPKKPTRPATSVTARAHLAKPSFLDPGVKLSRRLLTRNPAQPLTTPSQKSLRPPGSRAPRQNHAGRRRRRRLHFTHTPSGSLSFKSRKIEGSCAKRRTVFETAGPKSKRGGRERGRPGYFRVYALIPPGDVDN